MVGFKSDRYDAGWWRPRPGFTRRLCGEKCGFGIMLSPLAIRFTSATNHSANASHSSVIRQYYNKTARVSASPTAVEKANEESVMSKQRAEKRVLRKIDTHYFWRLSLKQYYRPFWALAACSKVNFTFITDHSVRIFAFADLARGAEGAVTNTVMRIRLPQKAENLCSC